MEPLAGVGLILLIGVLSLVGIMAFPAIAWYVLATQIILQAACVVSVFLEL